MDVYLQRYTRVHVPASGASLPASALAERAAAALERAAGPAAAGTARWLTVSSEPGRSALYAAYPPDSPRWWALHVDPYRGDVLIVRDMLWDPAEVLLRAHRSLLLPEAPGRTIVGAAVLVFVASLVTGLVLWFPRRLRDLRRARALRQRLTIDRRARGPRVVYDLHRVLGGYALAVAMVLALSGLVWSFPWVDRAVYWIATAGGSPPAPVARLSAPPPATSGPPAVDAALALTRRAAPGAASYVVGWPAGPRDPLSVCANPDAALDHRVECFWFDRHTGAPLGADRYADKNAGQRLRVMNYDVHVGRIAGLPGRVAACLASLIAASLPVTGALIWWNRG